MMDGIKVVKLGLNGRFAIVTRLYFGMTVGCVMNLCLRMGISVDWLSFAKILLAFLLNTIGGMVNGSIFP